MNPAQIKFDSFDFRIPPGGIRNQMNFAQTTFGSLNWPKIDQIFSSSPKAQAVCNSVCRKFTDFCNKRLQQSPGRHNGSLQKLGGSVFCKAKSKTEFRNNQSQRGSSCPGTIASKARKKSSSCEHTRTSPLKKSKAGPQDLNKWWRQIFVNIDHKKSINADATFGRKIRFLTKFLWRTWSGQSWWPKKFADGHKNAATIIEKFWVPWF